MSTANQFTIAELLALLDDGHRLLDEATSIERDKRRRNVSERLEIALAGCSQAAREGHQRATEHLKKTLAVIEQTQDRISRADRAAKTGQGTDTILESLDHAIQELRAHHDGMREEIDTKLQQLGTFNITLFGRTMSGKSTLMEILTKGDGESIGQGAQRTTRDVRRYEWQGLTVTDVPGIAAFGGQIDEETAYKAADQADLVLFLTTDDAPQPVEAEHLASLRQRGKHVMGIRNVKEHLGDEVAIRRFIRDHWHKHFDLKRLEQLSLTFDEMADLHTPGRTLELVNVHLLAKYLADRAENRDKPWRDDLDRASRFFDVEDRILDEVATNGIFLRMRSFLDSAAATESRTFEAMLKSAELSAQMGRRLSDRTRELHAWRESFIRGANQEFDRLIHETAGGLRRQVPAFAEDHCEDGQLSSKWNSRVQAANIEGKMRETQEKLAKACIEYFETLVEDIREEIRLIDLQFQTISLETGRLRDFRRMWNWGTAGISGTATVGLGIAALTNFWNPVGWVAAASLAGLAVFSAASFLVGRRFKSRDQQRREAIAKITSEIGQQLKDMEEQIRVNMQQWLDQFTGLHLNGATGHLNNLAQQYGQTAAFMRETARSQRDSLLDINRQTIELALEHLGHHDAIPNVARVARIPGQGMVLTTTSFPLPDSTVDAIGNLFNEAVVQIPEGLDARQIIEELTDCRWDGAVYVDEASKTARMAFDPDNREAQVEIRLASQLTGYHITNGMGE
ncbi:MAG: 50S ribosome-binding GTPase [Chloroflexi bacterium]|nr:50S ribosome-binding GTPase [Chloroflexota bacterium]